jgi:hypothetical protein
MNLLPQNVPEVWKCAILLQDAGGASLSSNYLVWRVFTQIQLILGSEV